MRVSGDRVCVWEEEVMESAAASASCSPAGVPLSCRYVDAGGVSRFGSLRYGCPSGWVLSGSSCSRSASVERTAPPAVAYSCGQGVLVGSSCVEYAEAVRSCLPGWVLRASGSCERVLREPARSESVSPTPTSTSTSTTTTSTTVVSTTSTTVAAVGPPGAPQNVRVSLGVGSASLRWEPPVSDGGSPIAGYRLEFREGISGARSVEELPASARRRAFSNLKGGVSYYVRLWAVNEAEKKSAKVLKGMSPCSAGEEVVVLARYDLCKPIPSAAPPSPGELVLTPGVGSLTASWGAPASSAGGAAVAGFSVEWRRERGVLVVGDGWSSPVKLEGADKFSHVIKDLTGGVTYQVRVKSFSAKGVNSPPVMEDGAPLVDHSCSTGSEPGFWRQVFDPALGVCVGPPGGFTVVIDKGVGELRVSARRDAVPFFGTVPQSFVLDSDPVGEYVVRWRRSGSSGEWSSVVVDPGPVRAKRYVSRPYHGRGSYLEYSFETRYRYGAFVDDLHVIRGLVNRVLYEVEVEARNAAGSSTDSVVVSTCPPESFDSRDGMCLAPGVISPIPVMRAPCPAGQVRPFDPANSRCAAPCPAGRVHRTPGDSTCINPSVPAAPVGVSVDPAPMAGTLDVYWKQSLFDVGGLALTGYVVRWRRVGGGGDWSSADAPAFPVPPAVARSTFDRQFRITGLTVGARYEVAVAARNSLGLGSYTSPRYTVRVNCGRTNYMNSGLTHIEGKGLCIFPPKQPAGLTVLAGATALRVFWWQEAWDNDYPVTGYKLRWRPLGTGAWTEIDVPWTSGVISAMQGPPRKDFTHTISNLPAGTFYEVQVAADNTIPGALSPWVTAEASNCPTGRVRFTASSGCEDIPRLPFDVNSPLPAASIHARTGSLRVNWWQNINLFTPDTYKVEWKKRGSVHWLSVEDPASRTEILLPSSHAGRSYVNWRLHSRELTLLDVCSYDVRVTAIKGTQELSWPVLKGIPLGTATTPTALQKLTLAEHSTGGDELYAYWMRPFCDGGNLTGYTVSYRAQIPTAGGGGGLLWGAWTDAVTVTDAAKLGRLHNGEAVGGLTAGTLHEVKVTVRNSGGLSVSRTREGTPEAVVYPVPGGSGVWRPYRMRPDKFASVSERIQMGLAIRVCTSAPDFLGALRRAIYDLNGGWNDALDGALPRSETAPAGAFVFGGVVSDPDDCGEEGNSDEQVKDNPDVDAVFMDYRTDCTASGATADVPVTNCRNTSCVFAASTSEAGRNCAARTTQCSSRAAACVKTFFAGDFRPRQTPGASVQMVSGLDDRVFLHELGHFVRFPDYGNGCHWISDNIGDKSLMSYGSDPDDRRDWERLVNTQNDEADDCRSDTITEIDKRNLHTLYHPAAFQSLDIVADPRNAARMYLRVGAPPRDLNGNSYYNAYRYVVLHRAPQGTRSTPNVFTQLMNGGEPVVFTPEQLIDSVNQDTADDVGYLDANGRFVVETIDLNDPVFSALRVAGYEFVFVGVTRGDPLRDPSKPLNPVRASGLEHAVMGLNLDLNASTGLNGVRNWTLGTPVSFTNP